MLNKLSNFNKGFLSSIGAVLCFSVITTFGVIVFRSGISPLSILTFRALITGLLLFLTVLLSRKLSFKIERQDRLKVLISSILLSVHLVLFWQGVKILIHIPTIYAAYFTYPFWILIFSCIFLSKRFTKIKWLSLLLGTVGTFFALGFLPSLSLAGINIYGIGLVLSCAAIWGATILINRQLFKKYSLFVILFYNFVVSFFIFSLFQSPKIMLEQISVVSYNTLFYLLMIAIISTYLAFVFLSNAIKRFGSANWGITNLSSPIFNAIVAFMFLGQLVKGWYQAFGILLTMMGVYLLYKNKKV
ncbi:MAG: DMT family transporter [Candidatus Heimdallarchaeaceae archaeon]